MPSYRPPIHSDTLRQLNDWLQLIKSNHTTFNIILDAIVERFAKAIAKELAAELAKTKK